MYYEYYDCDKCGVKCRHDEKYVGISKPGVFCELTAFEIYDSF